ncbi:MAG: glycosyltransferase [Myxococcales bacterium]|nr:glycosyltransferase [Myxococcales bacterium]
MLYPTLIAISSLSIVLFVLSVWRATRRTPYPAQECPISVLKPLCGADEALEGNLETFFTQDHPCYELVFGVEGASDPAIAVVERLRERYPDVRSRLIVHNGGRALNPKVSNLRAMLSAGSHDVVVISDSNVSVDPGYLSNMSAHLHSDSEVGLVTNLIAGIGEETLGATLENLHLNGTIAGSVAASQELGDHTLVIGKSMMFRRSVLEAIGGLESVATILAEDYVIGRMFRQAGYKVRIADGLIRNVNQATTVKRFFDRQLRWGMLRWRLKPFAFPAEVLINPITLAALAPFFGVTGPLPLLWAIVATFIRDGISWARLRGTAGLVHALPFALVKDALMLLVLFVAPCKRHVTWRGNRLRISSGTRLYAERPSADAPHVLVER